MDIWKKGDIGWPKEIPGLSKDVRRRKVNSFKVRTVGSDSNELLEVSGTVEAAGGKDVGDGYSSKTRIVTKSEVEK